METVDWTAMPAVSVVCKRFGSFPATAGVQAGQQKGNVFSHSRQQTGPNVSISCTTNNGVGFAEHHLTNTLLVRQMHGIVVTGLQVTRPLPALHATMAL